MEDYKQDIINTRKGCLGGSDARMLQSIATLGAVPKSAMKRLAVCKGFIEQEQFTNQAMQFGDFIENQVFESLKLSDSRWESNPCLVSKKYSRKNVRVIDHVDFLLRDDDKKTITIGECKATRYTYETTRREYESQLCHHMLMAEEMARELGKYKVRVLLCHYCTDGLDLDKPFEFDESRLTVKPLRLSKAEYDLPKAIDIVDEFLETFDYYNEDESIPYEFLPENVQKEFDSITALLTEIKQREATVEAFKAKLYDFLTEKNVKSIKNDSWSITRVDPTTSISFDSKKFLNEYAAKHPKLYKRLRAEYDRTTNKKGYVAIKINNNKND